MGWNNENIVHVASQMSNSNGAASILHFYAITDTGRVMKKNCFSSWRISETVEMEDWQNAKIIAGGHGHAVALMPDGTVRSEGFNLFGQTNTNEWEDIMDISSIMYTTIGLKADGTVVAVGDNFYGQCDVSEWTNIGFPDMDTPTNEIVELAFAYLFTSEEVAEAENTEIEK